MSNSAIVMENPPPDQKQNPESYESEPLAIPPLDPSFDLPFNFDDNYDFDINLDDLCFPSETAEFLIPTPPNDTDIDIDCRFESPISSDNDDVIAKYLTSESNSDSNCDSNSDHARVGAPNIFRSSPVSSHGSGNIVGSGVSDALNVPSPDNDSSGFNNFVVDQRIKLEEGINLKRKKNDEEENAANGVMRSQKCRTAVLVDDNSNSKKLSDEEEKRTARLMRNRESAQLSRQRKKHYVEELEDKVRLMHSTIADLQGKISYFMAENASLRQQLSGGGSVVPGAPPMPPPMYPPMPAYPWMPYAPYAVKPSGSQVPLVPIPRLKPQQPVSVPRGTSKKVESKKGGEVGKSKSKSKKVASVSFLGLLFFVLLFGGLFPVLDVNFGVKENWVGGSSFVGERFYDQHRGRVLMVNGQLNNSHGGNDAEFHKVRCDVGSRVHCDRYHGCKEHDIEKNKGGPESFPSSNASEPLFASLYVPRNDKLVKIDGNLIIHSVLASERAMASPDTPEVNNSRETGLAIPRDMRGAAVAISEFRSSKGRHPHLYQTAKEQQKALSSGSADTLKEQVKSSTANGKLQQWFQEGLAGPMLSSGMCTEVFQFDVSPASGAIVPASPLANVTSEHQQNSTYHDKGGKRMTMRGLPIPIPGSELNITQKRVAPSQKDNLDGNKTASSMVVSVLVDPREASDSDVDGVIRPKSLSRIFVVVLLDSVKYVTYSCVLPRSGPHLVTT